MSFDKAKLNSKGKSVKTHIKNSIEILKDSIYPNQRTESANVTKNEQLIFKYFTPTCLATTHWKELFNPSVGAETNLED